MMPMPFIPGMRPPILSTPTAGAAGNMQKKIFRKYSLKQEMSDLIFLPKGQ